MLMFKFYGLLFTLLTLGLAGLLHRAHKLRTGGKGMMTGGRKAIADGAEKIRSGRKQKRRSLLYYAGALVMAYAVLRVLLIFLAFEAG